MSDFVDVLGTADIAPGAMAAVDVEGTEAVVANVGGTFYAFGAVCPHEQGPLAEGDLDGDTVTCPWHYTQFDVRTGAVIDGLTDESIAVYEVRVDGDRILVRKP